MNYPGTILLVSHDRAFINNVVTSTLVFEGGGIVKEYVGGYDDWLHQRLPEPQQSSVADVKKDTPQARTPRLKPKFSQKQQREMDSLPHAIQTLETEQEELFRALGDPGLYKKDKFEALAKKERLEAIKKLLTESYNRWEELEQLKNESASN
jgi:ABC transport system ATP-binding/permease protein